MATTTIHIFQWLTPQPVCGDVSKLPIGTGYLYCAHAMHPTICNSRAQITLNDETAITSGATSWGILTIIILIVVSVAKLAVSLVSFGCFKCYEEGAGLLVIPLNYALVAICYSHLNHALPWSFPSLPSPLLPQLWLQSDQSKPVTTLPPTAFASRTPHCFLLLHSLCDHPCQIVLQLLLSMLSFVWLQQSASALTWRIGMQLLVLPCNRSCWHSIVHGTECGCLHQQQYGRCLWHTAWAVAERKSVVFLI